jgi:hypothetical protein
MLRSVQAVPVPIGNYVRPTRRDQRLMLTLLGEERLPTSGVVIDPALWDVHEELSREAAAHRLEVVLDSQALDLSTAAGFDRSGVRDLPWAGEGPHEPSDLRGDGGSRLVQAILDFGEGKPFTALLSPAHFLGTPDSEWFGVDIALARRMREGLDARGHSARPLYYPLIAYAEVIRNPGSRRRLMERLRDLDVDGIWLRVHPFGTTSSGPLVLRRYIEACRDLHALGMPIVGDRTGTVGVALAAFGALGAIEGGITLGERFDIGSLTRHRSGDPFAPPPRVYLREIGAFISRKQARQLFDQRGMKTAFGCQQDACCRRGTVDMIADPRRHFLVSRGRELSYLSSMPEPLRAGRYMEQFLRPATDLAVRAARALPALERHRRRLDSWREALGAIHRRDMDLAITYSRAPDGSRITRRLGA